MAGLGVLGRPESPVIRQVGGFLSESEGPVRDGKRISHSAVNAASGEMVMYWGEMEVSRTAKEKRECARDWEREAPYIHESTFQSAERGVK